ncbi:hypothetical protein MPSEU_000105000 [Mayamaea pseudoterrestris]|nr:hypothetical protein MPSEU_000105000 [Mayamaea pseudoterrestris]
MFAEEGLIQVSNQSLLLSIAPLLGLAYVSHRMGLAVESPIVVGVIRTLVQLSVLGAILAPIFNYGHDRWWVVILYVFFMVTLAALEASARSAYYFHGMLAGVFCAFAVNTALACAWAFGVILRPTPVWEPQYVIPITGMLLGNCINGVALSLNTALSSLVEQSNEVEMLLAFGATPEEASSRLIKEAIRIGAMPLLNSMAVIGLISIPGMMTGQILGGTPPFEAAKYQMLILYLIAMSAFGTILLEVWIVRTAGFDAKSHMLRVDKFLKRPKKLNFLERTRKMGVSLARLLSRSASKPVLDEPINESLTLLPGNADVSAALAAEAIVKKANLEIFALGQTDIDIKQESNRLSLSALEIKGLSKSFEAKERNDDDTCSNNSCDSRGSARLLFQNLSVRLEEGAMLALVGPSGAGKSQLLRILAWLTAPDEDGGQVHFKGRSQHSFTSPEEWRRQVRYVSQHKVDIPGTPSHFIEQICGLKSWSHKNTPTHDTMIASAQHFMTQWGLDTTLLASEWKYLSGGEAQRIYLAIAVASQPRVLLLDESTNSLDDESKQRVENTLQQLASDQKTSILWVSHDSDQLRRLGRQESLWSNQAVDLVPASLQ